MGRARKRPPEADVEVGAVARAKRLRFGRKPETEVRTHAQVEVHPALRDEIPLEGEGDSGSVRRNLPEEVEPGVTYRDVEVGWRAGAGVRLREDAPDE
jgi:hypothetical protein